MKKREQYYKYRIIAEPKRLPPWLSLLLWPLMFGVFIGVLLLVVPIGFAARLLLG